MCTRRSYSYTVLVQLYIYIRHGGLATSYSCSIDLQLYDRSYRIEQTLSVKIKAVPINMPINVDVLFGC